MANDLKRTHYCTEPTRKDEGSELVTALKSWRLAEAHRRRTPAFRILTDRTLLEMVAAKPRNEEELLEVRGIGPTLARKYGKVFLDLIKKGA